MNGVHSKTQFEILDALEDATNKIEAYASILQHDNAPNKLISERLYQITEDLRVCYQRIDREM